MSLLSLALAFALALAGCGGGGSSGAPPGATKKLPHVSAGPRQLKIERDHLALVAHGLRGAESSIRREARAARAAWPGIAHGLPPQVSPASRALITRALDRTTRLATPRFVSFAGELTGAAAAIAGLELSYEQLSQRGWTMTLAAAQHLGSGSGSSLGGERAGEGAAEGAGEGAAPGTAGRSAGDAARRPHITGAPSNAPLSPAALRFIRANASLYIGSVYDGHYNLSVVGERLREAYAQLGGPSAFGAALTPALLAQLASFYSPGVLRLAPKPPS
ncbi:MAG TPA: hypothetical protein VID70_01350 [Solirubrobacteraceae bacterium]